MTALSLQMQLSVSEAQAFSAQAFNTQAVYAGFQWDYVFDWTILKYQQTKNHAVARPDAAPAAQADPADTDKGDRSGFARASRGDSGRRCVQPCPTDNSIPECEALRLIFHVRQLLSVRHIQFWACCQLGACCQHTDSITVLCQQLSFLGTG